MEDALLMEHITKVYPNGVMANHDITFSVAHGEIHALCGENGAGKSTLMKILFGEERPTSGAIHMDGKAVDIASPSDALSLGIGMVHQHFMLVPSLTVWENIILGSESLRGLYIDAKRAMREEAALMKKFHMELDLTSRVRDLSVGQKQKLEILKILHRGARMLILDEPTAVLTPQETVELFHELELLRDEGYSVIFISHKLDEVRQLCSRVTIIRRGEGQGTFSMEDVSDEDILSRMVGHSVPDLSPKKPVANATVVVSVRNLVVKKPSETRPRVDHLGFGIRRGEILGIAGVEGNGQGELVEVLSGMLPATGGVANLHGTVISRGKVARNRALGVCHIPEDRMTIGMAGKLSIAENVVADKIKEKRFSSPAGILHVGAIRQYGQRMVSSYAILCPDASVPVESLSGGNIQKVVLARELDNDPAFVIADQPTRGVDAGASAYIRDRLIALRNAGAAILLVSSDLQELRSLSDRILVMVRGSSAACFSDLSDVTDEVLGRYMLGLSRMDDAERRRNSLEDEPD